MQWTKDNSSSTYRWLAWMLCLGIGWRVLRWSLGMPMWGDEVMLALNFLDRDWVGWLQPLEMGQVAPPMFMLLHGLLMQVVGYSEWVLRLPSLVFGIGALLLFARFVYDVVEQRSALCAVAVLAVSYYCVRHGSEFKPYALDLLLAVALLFASYRFRCNPLGLWQISGLVLVIVLAPLCSFPSVFVTVGVVTGLLADALVKRERYRLYLTFGITLLAIIMAFTQYTVIIAPQAQANELLKTLWQGGFPPGDGFGFLGWFVTQSAGRLMAYPLGGRHFGSVLTLFLMCVGVVSLYRTKHWFLLWILLIPFVGNVVAAALHLYPYGQSARIAQHLAPSICLLAGVGIVTVLLGRSRLWVPKRLVWVLCGLSVIGVAGMGEVVAKPYKSRGDLLVRELIQQTLPALGCRTLQVLNIVDTVPVNFRWYLAIDSATRFGVDPVQAFKHKDEPVCLLLFDAERDPDTSDRLDYALEKISASQQLIRDEVKTAYIYGGTHHPHQVRSIVSLGE